MITAVVIGAALLFGLPILGKLCTMGQDEETRR